MNVPIGKFKAEPSRYIRHAKAGKDTVHLAAADILRDVFGEVTFACFDADLSRAATARGMTLLPAT